MTTARTETLTGHARQPSVISKLSMSTLYTLTPPTEKTKPEVLCLERWRLECLGVSSTAILLLVIIVPFLFYYKGRLNKDPFSYCDTEACASYTGMISRAVNLNSNPCADFYAYVCGGWRDEKSAFKVYLANLLRDLVKILEQPVPRRGQNATDRAARFFQSCVAAFDGRRGAQEDFKRVFLQCGIEWPRLSQKPDALRSLVCIVNRFDYDNLMLIGGGAEKGTRVALIARGATGVYFSGYRETIIQYNEYTNYYENFQEYFKAPGDKKEDFVNYTRFFEAENAIYGALMKPSKSAYGWHKSNLSLLAHLTPEIGYDRWSKVFQSELGVSSNAPVVINGEDHISAFSRLFSTVGERFVHYQVGWIALQFFAAYMNRKGAELYSGDVKISASVNVRKCLTATDLLMGWAMYERFFGAKLNTRTLLDLYDIMDNVVATTTAALGHSQKHSGAVLRSGMNKLLPPPLFRGKSLNRVFANISDMGPRLTDNWLTMTKEYRTKMDPKHLSRVRVFFQTQLWEHVEDTLYNSGVGTYVIPPNALVLPVYDVDVVRAVKYGAFGTLLAEAALGLSQHPAEAIAEEKCFNESLSDSLQRYVIVGNVASLQVAWDAYRNDSHADLDVRLQGIPALTGQQLFFLASCHILCGQPRYREPSRRCNEAVKHHPHFAKAYSCSDGTPMNPKNRCPVFSGSGAAENSNN